MKYIRKFNESKNIFQEIEFDEEMMYKTSMIINLIPQPYEEGLKKLDNCIKSNLDKDILYRIGGKTPLLFFNSEFTSKNIVSDFITSMIDDKDMEKISNVITHPGADDELEFVVSLEINNRIVLILHSPDRGSSLRIEDDNYKIKFDEVLKIIEVLCQIYNEKLSK